MISNEERNFIQEFRKKANLAGINMSFEYTDFILNEYRENPDIDIEYFFVYENRIKLLEERIQHKLPDDFVEFMKEYDGVQTVNGEWFSLEEMSLAIDFDIINFIMIEEESDLLNLDDCNYLMPILVDNDAYVVMDLRENGKGVFVIWSDEEELGFQQTTFSEFIENLREEIKAAKEADNDNFCFNYLDKYND